MKLATIFPACLAGLLVWRATASGLWFGPDARAYHDAARSFAETGGLWSHDACGGSVWLTTFPPLFPLVAGLGALFGLDLMAWGRILNCLCAAVSAGFLTAAARTISGSAAAGWLAGTALALLPDFVDAHRSFLSEPMFYALFFAGLYFLSRGRMLGASSLFGLSAAVRFAGAPLVAACAWLEWRESRSLRAALRVAVTGAVPTLIALAANLYFAGRTSDREIAFDPIGLEYVRNGLSVAAGWVGLGWAPMAAQAAIFAVVLWLTVRGRNGFAVTLLAAYLAFLLITRLWLDSQVELLPRYMVPAFALLLLAFCDGVRGEALFLSATALFVVFRLVGAFAPPVMLTAKYNSNHPYWAQSETLRRASELREISCRYASRPDLIYLQLAKPAEWLPRRQKGYTKIEDRSWCENVRSGLAKKHPAAFLFFDIHALDENAQVTADELSQCIGPSERTRLADGEIIVVR